MCLCSCAHGCRPIYFPACMWRSEDSLKCQSPSSLFEVYSLVFHCIWYACWPKSFWEFSVSASHIALYYRNVLFTIPGSTWILGVQTQVRVLEWQALYSLSHVPILLVYFYVFTISSVSIPMFSYLTSMSVCPWENASFLWV